MKKIKNILIFGPQGSGKDTQSEMLADYLKIPFVVMGNLFREEIKKQTEIGKLADCLIKEGKLAPDEMTISLVEKRLKEKDAQKGYILNGFPRNLIQTRALDKFADIDLVIELKVSDHESIRRLSGRLFCPACGATFHVQYKPPQKKNVCDFCQAKLVVREDDKPEITKKRLAIYHQQTEPIFDYYKKRGLYLEINGEQSIKDVFKEIKEKLESIQ